MWRPKQRFTALNKLFTYYYFKYYYWKRRTKASTIFDENWQTDLSCQPEYVCKKNDASVFSRLLPVILHGVRRDEHTVHNTLRYNSVQPYRNGVNTYRHTSFRWMWGRNQNCTDNENCRSYWRTDAGIHHCRPNTRPCLEKCTKTSLPISHLETLSYLTIYRRRHLKHQDL